MSDWKPPPIGGCEDVDPVRVSIPERIAAATAMAARAYRLEYLQNIAASIRGARMDPMEAATLALTWVGEFEKVPDCDGSDAVADPLATLRCKKGDCLNLCCMLLALLWAMGQRARLQPVYLPKNKQDHVAVQVWDGTAWTWADPMGEPAILGKLAVSEPWTTTPSPMVS